ncbi:hypothetical protein IAD21_04088 [Abditibacteriota bacterium]|nr:hypothetical protein IAD21_04088 [Abditibacteriota bacterium]
MPQIHEEDVVIAFRQTLEEELRRVQRGDEVHSVYHDGASTEENLQRLVKSHLLLQSEVALLRTVILKLLSEPVDSNAERETPSD